LKDVARLQASCEETHPFPVALLARANEVVPLPVGAGSTEWARKVFSFNCGPLRGRGGVLLLSALKMWRKEFSLSMAAALPFDVAWQQVDPRVVHMPVTIASCHVAGVKARMEFWSSFDNFILDLPAESLI
jgi:hypothetical protein